MFRQSKALRIETFEHETLVYNSTGCRFQAPGAKRLLNASSNNVFTCSLPLDLHLYFDLNLTLKRQLIPLLTPVHALAMVRLMAPVPALTLTLTPALSLPSPPGDMGRQQARDLLLLLHLHLQSQHCSGNSALQNCPPLLPAIV